MPTLTSAPPSRPSAGSAASAPSAEPGSGSDSTARFTCSFRRTPTAIGRTAGLGRRALRLTHDQVIYDWETTFLSIKRVVDDAKREQARRFGLVILRADDPL